MSNHNITFQNKLNDKFSKLIDEYASSELGIFRRITKTKHKRICVAFCSYLQNKGITCIDDIGYPDLEHYYQFADKLYGLNHRYRGVISRFLKYLATKGHCSYGFSLFMIYHDKCTSMKDISVEFQTIVGKYASASYNFPASEFYQSIHGFCDCLLSLKYAEDVIHKISYQLKLLFLFLDREHLTYERVIADAWYNEFGSHIFGTSRAYRFRRTLDLFDEYIQQGYIIPQLKHNSLVSEYDRLPKWCKDEIDNFLVCKRKEGNRESSIERLRVQISRFCRALINMNIDSFSKISRETIKQFILTDKHETIQAKNIFTGVIRKFIVHLELHDILPSGLHYAISVSFSKSEKIIDILESEDLEKIDSYCKKASTPIELRDAAILRIGMNTGFRPIDILGLKKHDIDWKSRCINIVQTKTGVSHTHFLRVETLNAIYRYIRDARPRDIDSDYLFVSVVAPYVPITNASGACQMAMKRAGLSKITPRYFRRTYASQNLNIGATVSETAILLGHTTDETVSEYAALDSLKMAYCPLSMAETGLTLSGRYRGINE